MKLYLVRHGETVENAEGRIQGQTHGRLSENGKSQVKRLAERLRNEEFDCIYCSDLARAKDTAEAIHRFHPGKPLIAVKELRERSFGPYEGEFCDDHVWAPRGKVWTFPPEVEPDAKLLERCRVFLDRVYHDHARGSVLFVSHGGTLNALLSVVAKRGGEEIDFIHLHNTSITIVEFDEDRGHHIHLLNCVQHLE